MQVRTWPNDADDGEQDVQMHRTDWRHMKRNCHVNSATDSLHPYLIEQVNPTA